MDDAAILERAARAARYRVEIEGRSFLCALPDAADVLIELQAIAPDADLNTLPRGVFVLAATAASVTGWEGVLEGDLFEGDPAAPQPFSRIGLRHLLRTRPQWQIRLRDEYVAREGARAGISEAAAKN